MFGIWYLFFKISLFSDLASSAILTLLSFLTVKTTGWMNISSVILSTRLMWPAASRLFISASTAVCSCNGTLLPFCWVTLAPSLNSVFIVCPVILPCLLKIFSVLVLIPHCFQFYLQNLYTHLLCLLPLLYSLVVSTNLVPLVISCRLLQLLFAFF